MSARPEASSAAAEPDCLPGAPLPRERSELFGHADAERVFLDAFASGRVPHAWLIGGPQGIGKATFCYRVARFALAHGSAQTHGAEGLDVDPSSPVWRQVAALAHPNLVVLRRVPATEKKSASTTIPIDQVRRARTLFGSTAANSGYRVCIVDSAEDLAGPSANALLKLVEEPPPRSLFLIVSHAPQRVLPTIRSRCRRLQLSRLGDADLRAVVRSLGSPFSEAPAGDLDRAVGFADGSARRALELLDSASGETIESVSAILELLPRRDLKRIVALAERLAKKGAERDFELAVDTVQRWASTMLNAHAGEGALRLAPLVEVCEKIARAAREVDVYNLDRRPLVLAMFGDLADAVGAAGR